MLAKLFTQKFGLILLYVTPKKWFRNKWFEASFSKQTNKNKTRKIDRSRPFRMRHVVSTHRENSTSLVRSHWHLNLSQWTMMNFWRNRRGGDVSGLCARLVLFATAPGLPADRRGFNRFLLTLSPVFLSFFFFFFYGILIRKIDKILGQLLATPQLVS